MNIFEQKISSYNGKGLHGIEIKVLQINVGLECNQKCSHCHVSASPDRKEQMSWETMENIILIAEKIQPDYIDITGGEPEIHPYLQDFIQKAKEKKFALQLRSNLSLLTSEIIHFLKSNEVKIIASMPCYLKENVDKQRGEGTYEKSIKALQQLNSNGYGVNSNLELDLVYNPGGYVLPPNQNELQKSYKKELGKHGILFNKLIAITNIPLGRFLGELKKDQKVEEYNNLLISSFNPETLTGLMCRHQVNIGWNGKIYDCDFNMAIGLDIDKGLPQDIKDFNPDFFHKRRISTGTHCFGCTAGAGSSCSGALS
ncbi:MAG: arsenosugar biosynthesis radical SAM protein ArsS [Nitrospinae bacterium]|nr:arsenosugar biosynthesis radical SAM protein ArsS [Nitrospinota bacterium]